MNSFLSGVLSCLVISSFLLILFSFNLYAEVVGNDVYQKLNSRGFVRVIVVLRSGDAKFTDLSSKMNTIKDRKSRVMSKLSSNDFSLIKSWDTVNAFSGFVSLQGLVKLSEDPDVKKVDLDTGGKGGLLESKFLINADDVNNAGFTGQGVIVAVLDTGINTNGIDLANDLVGQQCFCENDNGSGCCPSGVTVQSGSGSAEDDNGHGSNIAGIITSDGLVAPEGVARDAKIVAVKVLDSTNSFSGVAQIISGLEWVLITRPDVDIVNMSLGTSILFDQFCDNASATNMALSEAVQNLVDTGVPVFTSSQNDGSADSIAAPACFSNTISVGAVYDADDQMIEELECEELLSTADEIPCFSNSSAQLDMLAPGAKITSTGNNLLSLIQSGTSQSSAHAAATAALMLEADPDLTPSDIREILKDTGVIIQDPRNGLFFPRIDVLAAINFITGLNITNSNNPPSSLCAIGGNVSPLQFLAIILIYFIPVSFIVFRRYHAKKKSGC